MKDNDEEKEEVLPIWLYKDGDGKVFEGDAVAAALKDGWKDTPQEPTPESKPESKSKAQSETK